MPEIDTTSKRSPTVRYAIFALYVVMLGGVVGGLFYVRNWSRTTFDNPNAQEEWETWRQAVQDQKATNGSVSRRVPKSPAPPSLVLLNDYFTVCLIISVVLSSVLFATFAFVINGVLTNPGQIQELEDD